MAGQGRLRFSVFEAERHSTPADVRQTPAVKMTSTATKVAMRNPLGFRSKTLVQPTGTRNRGGGVNSYRGRALWYLYGVREATQYVGTSDGQRLYFPVAPCDTELGLLSCRRVASVHPPGEQSPS